MLTYGVVLRGGPLDGTEWRVTGSSPVICIPLNSQGEPDPRARLDKKFGWLEYVKLLDGHFTFQGKKP